MAKKATEETKTTLLELPVPEIDGEAYLARHVEIARLSVRQARALRRLCLGFDAEGARLSNGKRINGPTDALRLLLERIEDAVAAE
jgi:hypothetical protein